MTPNEIIERARLHFGEKTAQTLLAPDFEKFFNDALQEAVKHLPSRDLRPLWQTDTVSFTTGQGSIPETWDRLLTVIHEGAPVHQVSRDTITIIDYSVFNEPLIPVFAHEERTLWVRPASVTSVTVTHIDPPAEVTDFEVELDAISHKWHPALALLVASKAYAQEEDPGQADLYFKRFLVYLGGQEAAAS